MSGMKYCDECKQYYTRSYYFTHHNHEPKKARMETNLTTNADSPVHNIYEDSTVSYSNAESTTNVLNEDSQEHIENEDLFEDVINEDSSIHSDESTSSPSLIFSDTSDETDDSDDSNAISDCSNKIGQKICFFLLLWQATFKISNNAMNVLLKFITLIGASFTGAVSHLFSNYYKLAKAINPGQSIVTYIVCPKCFKLYNSKDCSFSCEGKMFSKTCNNVNYPNHVQNQRRKKCGANLLEAVKLPNGKEKLVPIKTYCYRPLKQYLQDMLMRPNFQEKCETWRNRTVEDGVMEDYYDGRVWKEWHKNGYFGRNDYGIMINVDWFQLHEHVQYSIGAIYAAVMNLPRAEPFLKANIILLGIIPKCKKEPNLNSFLQPIVDELIEAMEPGFDMYTYDSPKKTENFRIALLCVGCDVPAARKCLGFLGHGATLGCSKCKQQFKGPIGHKDYSGFDRASWIPRTDFEHRRDVCQVERKGITATKKKAIESKLGVRYSELLRLSYFDVVRFHIIDPMHNLFLGSAKTLLCKWMDMDLLTSHQCGIMQEIINSFIVPPWIGRIPHKLGSGFASFTADQWMSWTIVFSTYILHGRLPPEHLDCWKSFVLACAILVNKVITVDSVRKGDNLLLMFCSKCENLYGKQFIKPNMHLHGHLGECILDYGPLYGFWLFAYERWNGLATLQKTNKRNMEGQIMKKFLQEIYMSGIDSGSCSSAIEEQLQELINSMHCETNRGTLSSMLGYDTLYEYHKMSDQFYPITSSDWTLPNEGILQLKYPTSVTLYETELKHLQEMYAHIYNGKVSWIAPSAQQYKYVKIFGHICGTQCTRNWKSSFVMAYWCGPTNSTISTDLLRPGKIVELYLHHIKMNDKIQSHCLAKIEWFLPSAMKEKFGKPVEVYSVLCENLGTATFMPIQRIRNHFACVYKKINGRQSIIICLLVRHI